jgi:hypothetical protein
MSSPTPTPDPDSPFASFAQPKPSALKQFVERQHQSAQSSKAHWQYLGAAYATTVLAAATAVAIGVGTPFFTAVALGAGGALAGVPAGWLLGAISWALMRNRMMGAGGMVGAAMASSQVHAEVVRSNSWSRLLMWLTVWAAFGMVIGAAAGTMLAADPVDRGATDIALGWGMAGACLGLMVETGAWLAWRRHRSGKPDPNAP